MVELKNFIQINNLPIRYKLISHFLIISIIPIICLGFLINWTVERVVEEQVNQNTLQLISKVNETLEFYINNMQRVTYFISYNERIEDFFIIMVSNLVNIKQMNMRFNAIFVILQR